MAINTEKLEAFEKLFNRICSDLYENPDHVNTVYVDLFNEYMSSNPNFRDLVAGFVSYRGDFIGSDREAAAFVLALLECRIPKMA